MLSDESGGRRCGMKKFLVVLFLAGVLAAALLAQGAAAQAPYCTPGYCAFYDTGR
jgi:hypothetical protein